MILPNFLVIGAHKAGTTSLHDWLRQHPDVFMPACKEPRFFSYNEHNPRQRNAPRSEQPVRTLEEYGQLFAAVRDERAIGEASPAYLPSAGAVQRAAALVPEARLVVSLRNPVDRQYSLYQMHQRAGRLQHSVEEHLANAELKANAYFPALQRWIAAFGRERLHVILFDELSAQPAATMRALFRFLGVDAAFAVDTSRRLNEGGLARHGWLHRALHHPGTRGLRRFMPAPLLAAGRHLRSRNLVRAEPLPAALRAELTAHCRDDVLRTQDLLGIDLSRWLAPAAPAARLKDPSAGAAASTCAADPPPAQSR